MNATALPTLETVAPGQLRLRGELTLQNAGTVLAQLEATARKTAQLQLDISGIEHSDSVLLAAIVGVARGIIARGGVFTLIGCDDRVLGLARLYGIDELITSLQPTGA